MNVWVIELSDYIDPRAVSEDWSAYDVLCWGLAELGWTDQNDWQYENIWIEQFEDEFVCVLTSSGDNLLTARLTNVVS